MSLRGYRVYGRCLHDGAFSVLVESVHNGCYLRLQGGALLELSKEAGEELKRGYVKIADGYNLLGILRLSEAESYLVIVSNALSVGQLHNSKKSNCDIYKITNVQFVRGDKEPGEYLDQRLVDLQRLLSAGVFYYAYSTVRDNLFNLCLSAQQRSEGSTTNDGHRFFWCWNRALCFPFERFGILASDWCVKCICGSVLVRTIYVGAKTAKVAIISRMSCERVGTRFNVRGVNDEGHTANFVETEQLVTFEDQHTSFVQIRGSVPLFWDQPGINIGSHKVKLKAIEISMPALERHFNQLRRRYGGVSTVNLLGAKEGERLLSSAFAAALKASSHQDMLTIPFDYHAQMKRSKDSAKDLLGKLERCIEECSYYYRSSSDAQPKRQQTGVIRTNCLDCLDRTNSVQTLIGMRVLPTQLACLGTERVKSNISGRFEEVLRDLWQKNGDQCSLIYAGTGALEGKSKSIEPTFKLKDASRSIARTIQNNLLDSAKQESFDLLLLGRAYDNQTFDRAANLLPLSIVRECPYEVEAFVERGHEMCTTEPIRIFAGTWNVNGGKNMYNVAFRHEQSLNAWIFPEQILALNDDLAYDIVAVGLEEIVDLNAGNLMKASTTNQRVWRDGIKKAINEHEAVANHKYVVVACEQLVGVCLVLLVKTSLLMRVRDLAFGEVKTGMGGAAGNKGSVAVRMTINSTSVCFVCSHFAAGQNDVHARNDDYQTAIRKIRFSMGRTIGDHDVVIWLGDFNYRISLPGDEVKAAVRTKNYMHLVAHDQLSQQKEAGNVFYGFYEGVLDFAPTYKYDTFSDDYDTSEKCRSPAWTDRVLWRDPWGLVDLVRYGRSELKTSDHRPVFAILRIASMKAQWEKSRSVLTDVVHSMGPPDATILCAVEGCEESFPIELCGMVKGKLEELGVGVIMSKIEGRYLHVILHSGAEALAALSMDHLTLTCGRKLGVALKSPLWADQYANKLQRLLESFLGSEPAIMETGTNGREWSTNFEINNLDDDGDEENFDQVESGLIPPNSNEAINKPMTELRIGK